ncbi:MAG: 5-oxoprolinase subunit PxpB [Algicola sp.]|nr:5-oxoprolinase subunit PxpB [Algicola sp.]
MSYQLHYKRFSERAILVSWPTKIDKKILEDLLSFKNYILNNDIKEIVYVNNAYNSLLIYYKLTIDNVNDEILRLKDLYSSKKNQIVLSSKLWKIPVCYDEEFGLDLNDIATQNNQSIDDVILWHSTPVYTVFFIGFLPGFLYLGGLDERLFIPRRKTPRARIEKGAVAIGGNQTGIYPNVSPGGWHIIGNTPIELFDVNTSPPCMISAGDCIKFEPVSRDAYEHIKQRINEQSYELKFDLIHG